tara:strand:+ start:5685 stop:6476 length:792 start_codon:yes stop_codon:yes gene_type:complete
MKVLIFFFGFMCSLSLNAWWDTAHKMVCDKAYELLAPTTKDNIDPLIKEMNSFGEACLWADWIKAEERTETRSWHYINLPDSEQDVSEARCPENGCLIDSFYKQMKILKDKSSSYDEQKEALWFIGHFVGDIHQPMHVGYPHDRGGNDHLLEFMNGRKTNMHSLWDGQIIEYMEQLHDHKYLSIKVDKKIKKFLAFSHSNKIESWAQESRNLAMNQSVGYKNNKLKIITEDYMESHFDIIQERVALGAIRLSQILDAVYIDLK